MHANRTRTCGYNNDAAEESARKKLLLSTRQIANVSAAGLARHRSRGFYTRAYIERTKPKKRRPSRKTGQHKNTRLNRVVVVVVPGPAINKRSEPPGRTVENRCPCGRGANETDRREKYGRNTKYVLYTDTPSGLLVNDFSRNPRGFARVRRPCRSIVGRDTARAYFKRIK